MIPRYQTEIMRQNFSDENKLKTWYSVEIAYLDAYLTHQAKPNQALVARLRAKAQSINWLQFAIAVDKYDREVKHDVIAFLHALEDELKDDARLIHLGLTSSDIVDTSFAILLKAAGEEIIKKLTALIDTLWQKAEASRGVLCLGRTHGQAAEPTTFGIKLLGYLCELLRSNKRLQAALKGIAVGKFSGAVGVYGHTNPEVEKMALTQLGLAPETIATQVVARDRHAALFASLAVLGGSIERIATEIRLLMHGQVKEVYEPFHARQKGSSAMPHKRNPILSENLCGLMRLMRSYALAALEDQALWHERDISHSSVERVIAPDAFSVMDFALMRLNDLIKNLVIDKEQMSKNLTSGQDILCSQTIMLALIEKGLMRKEAYEIVQKAALLSHDHDFKENLFKAGIGEHLSRQELDNIFSKSLNVHQEELLFERVKELKAHLS